MSETLEQRDTEIAVRPEGLASDTKGLEERLAYVFSSPQVLLKELSATGYITDDVTAYSVWYAYKLDRPIIQEGPAGAGKTQLALSVAKVTGMEIVRLQCYPGITDDKAIGQYNRALQELYVLVNKDRDADFDEIRTEIMKRKFFTTGPLLYAIESPKKCILLIDEVDKVPEEFEAMLLELLSVWEISAPGLGTIPATTKPLTFLTSNAVRDLADPLRRRSIYTVVRHPTAMLEARIVAYKTASLPIETHVFIAGLAQTLRTYRMKKHPSISEMSDIATAMEMMGMTTILPEHQEIVLPLLAKRTEDIDTLRLRGKFAALVTQTNDYVARIKLLIAVKRGLIGADILKYEVERVRESAEIREMLNKVKILQFPEEEMKQIAAEIAAAKERK